RWRMRSLKAAGEIAVACAAARKLSVRLAARKHWRASMGGRLMPDHRTVTPNAELRIIRIFDSPAMGQLFPRRESPMTRDTYERALNSAAQIAFLTFVAGCGGATAIDGPEQKPNSPAPPDDQQSAVTPAKTTYGGSQLTDKSCKDAIHTAYPNGDPQ